MTIHEELDDLLDFASDMEPHPALIAWCDLRDVLGGHFYQRPLGVLLFLNGPASLSHPSVYYYGFGVNIWTCCLGVLQVLRLVSYPRFVDVWFMVRSVRQAGPVPLFVSRSGAMAIPGGDYHGRMVWPRLRCRSPFVGGAELEIFSPVIRVGDDS